MERLGIYIHIPFCVSRCNYCGFFSNADWSVEEQRKYVDSLISDIIESGLRYRDGYKVDSVFIGGGTPSVLEPLMIKRIIGNLYSNFNFTFDAEITIEANPGTLDGKKLKAYKDVGVNRLSMGLQSFDDSILKKLGRVHTVDQFRENFFAAREMGFDNINIDLMFAVPGHTMEIWQDTLQQAIKLNPEHISFYSLQLEEGTPFFKQFQEGKLDQVSDELDRQMYHWGVKKLKEAGYDHYEISNCSKPGFQCRHNLKYWSMDPYLGLGDSASSYIDGIRFSEKPYFEYHENTFADDTSEFVFTGLRKTDGISLEAFKKKYKNDFWKVFGDRREELKTFFESGALIEEDGILRLSEEGIDVSNKIMSIFV